VFMVGFLLLISLVFCVVFMVGSLLLISLVFCVRKLKRWATGTPP
jgi:hypothetical protein